MGCSKRPLRDGLPHQCSDRTCLVFVSIFSPVACSRTCLSRASRQEPGYYFVVEKLSGGNGFRIQGTYLPHFNNNFLMLHDLRWDDLGIILVTMIYSLSDECHAGGSGNISPDARMGFPFTELKKEGK
jgi:hypothetical protein